MGTGGGGEEETGRSSEEPSWVAWGFLEPPELSWGHGGSPAPCCAPAFVRLGSGVSSWLQGQLPPLSNGTTAVPASRGRGDTP